MILFYQVFQLLTANYFTGTVNAGATMGGATNYNYTIDFFSQMDMILVLTDGVMAAKF